MRNPVGTGFYTKEPTNTAIHTALCNAAGYARQSVLVTGSTPPTDAGIFANGAKITILATLQTFINGGADGATPAWVPDNGGGAVRLVKMAGVNLNGALQVTMVLSSVTGTFVAGETVTDGTSGATGVVVVGGTTSIVVKSIVGSFGAHTVTGGTSGATGTWVSNTNLSTVDQAFTIPGGATFMPTSFLVTNASTSLTTASGIQLYTAVGRTGTEIGHTGALSGLTTASKVLNGTMDDTTQTIGTPVYVTLTTPQGGAATADIYLFGYILA